VPFNTHWTPPSGCPQRISVCLRIWWRGFLLATVLLSLTVAKLWAQSNAGGRTPAITGDKRLTQAQAELASRIAEANAARESGDPAQIGLTNKNLISLALREMAQLRLLEAAYPQAAELYRKSLDFSDVPDTHVDLAIALLDENRLQEAIAECEIALAVDPNNERAYSARGLAQLRKQDYSNAADSLSKAQALNPNIETAYSLAIALLSTKDPGNKDRAALVFRKMIGMAGDTGSLHVLFGRAYRDAEYMPDAVDEFQRAIALDPRTPHAHYFLGLARLTQNEWKPTPEATAEIKKELEYYPHDFLANYMVGFLASSERQYDVSDKYLKIAAEINPSWPEPWLYMGLNAYAQGDMKRAEETLRKAIELTGQDESRSNYQIRRAYVDLGRILTNSGRKEEAEKYLAKARELQNKTMEQTQQGVSAMAVAAGAGSAAAIVPLNKESENEAAPLLGDTADPIARVDPSVLARANLSDKQRAAAARQETNLRAVLGLAYNDLATSEALRNAYLTALQHYQEAEKWDPAIPGLSKNLGLCAFRANNYPEAIRALSRALAENPDQPALRAMLGMAYFGTDKYPEAASTFAPLGTRGMEDPAVGYAWAASLARAGDLKRASDVLTHFESGERSNETLLLVGQLWIEIGDYARAIAALQRSLQSGQMPKAHFYAGVANLRWEHWPEAEKEFRAELAMNPKDTEAKYNLGFVCLQTGKPDEAMVLFEQVVSDHPEHANAQYQLGKLLLDEGKIKEGTAHLESAARLSPQTDYVHYQLQAAYRKDSRTADADRELEIYKALKSKSRESSGSLHQQNP
jgi:tetratricopeptide (TPR) repeat protein